MNLGTYRKKRKQIRSIQIHLQHSRTTKDLMKKTEAEEPDLLLIQEPYEYKNRLTGMSKQYRIFTAGKGKHRAAIIITNSKNDAILISKLSDEDTVVV